VGELDLQRLERLEDVLDTDRGKIVDTLRHELERMISSIDSGLRDGDLAAVAAAAHSGRNSALMIDAQPVLADLEDVERCARSGQPEAAASAHGRLCQSWQALSARLAEISGAAR